MPTTKGKPFCYAPWVQLYARSSSMNKPKNKKDTEFSPCCEWRGKPLQFNIEKREKSFYWQNIKKAMIKKDMSMLSKTCAECIDCEQRGAQSTRLYIKKYVERKNNPWILDKINQIDFRPSNLCNMRCGMCNSSNSSLLAKEFGETVYQFDSKNIYDLDLSNLKKIKILGGEPSIQPEVYEFLEYFLKTYNNRPNLHFTTNMTNVNKRWLGIINKFDEVHIDMSIDGAGKTFEYLRPPGKWHIIKRNIKTIQEYSQTKHVSLRLKFHVTIGLVAMLTVDDWLPYFLKNTSSAEFYTVHGIRGGQLTCIPKNYLKPVIKYLQKINHPYADEILRIIQNIGEYNPVHLNGFKDQTTDRDILLKRDIKLLSPSLHKLLT
jgi:hypothetical protein